MVLCLGEEMVDSVSKNDCCGCEACSQACPVHCIDMREDKEGFLFPKVDASRCLKCGKCTKVCPVLNDTQRQKPNASYAYRSNDEELLKKTSSGGFFTAAAEKVLAIDGVVFGAAFNEKNEVVHAYVESSDELDSLRRSKYVQSRVGNAFVRCKRFLDDGRKVLFCGTPCQIRALKLFLGREYASLTTIDFVCHGVPSPGVYRRYLEELAKKKDRVLSDLHDVNFRDKGLGYAYSFSFSFSFSSSFFRENPKENIFLKGFLADLYLRRSCHNCKAKGFSSGADYTMCDFWTVEKFLPGFADKAVPGVSQVFVFNDKLDLFGVNGTNKVCKLDLKQKGIVQKWALQSVPMTRHRAIFYESQVAGARVADSVMAGCETTMFERFVSSARRVVVWALKKIGAK